MNWLKGGPFLELSFLHLLKGSKITFAKQLITKLQNEITHFSMGIDSYKLEQDIIEFDKGYPFDDTDKQSPIIHSLQIPIYLEIEGRRKSVISLQLISANLLIINFWFFGGEDDVPEWNQIGFKKNQFKTFKKFQLEICHLLKFPISTIEFENDITDIFDTEETWPNESYKIPNIKPLRLNSYLSVIIKEGFIDSSALKTQEIENGFIIIEKE